MKGLRFAASVALATAVLSLPGFAPQQARSSSSEYPSPMVREEQKVIVDGQTEVWQLKWAAKPTASRAMAPSPALAPALHTARVALWI